MGNVNINTGAPGNPLDALIAQNGGSLFGSTGFNVENALAQSRAGTIDPRIAAMGYHRTPYDDTYQFDPTDQNVDSSGAIMRDGRQYHQLASTSIGGQGQPIDPSKVIYDPKYGLLTPQENLKPISNGYGDMVFGLAALGLGLPTAMAAMGGAAGGTSLEALGIDASPISVQSLGSVPQMASTDSIMGYGGAGAGAGGLGAGGAGNLGNAAGSGGSLTSGGYVDDPGFVAGDAADPGSMSSMIGRGGSSIADWVAKNPLQAARLGIGVGSALAGASGSSHGGGGSSGSDMGSIIEQMANANRVNQNTPIGSRQWVHNSDGTWTVNDSMSAPEKQNFENVQGMNADVTGMARQRLAQLLAQPFDFGSYYQRAGAGG